MNRVFIGYDPRQPVSFTALVQSILSKASEPVAITPIMLETLPCKRQGLTPFTYSRFLVPWLCDYQGWALFLDIDMMLRTDIAELFALRDEEKTVMVSKHPMKFERASMMLFNNARCDVLTPEYVAVANDLHSIGWAHSNDVGDLPREWNHLVGYDAPNQEAKLAHFTQGVPIYPETKDSEFGEEWRQVAQSAVGSVTWKELMGNSVHAKPVYERLQSKTGT